MYKNLGLGCTYCHRQKLISIYPSYLELSGFATTLLDSHAEYHINHIQHLLLLVEPDHRKLGQVSSGS
jgi:poly-beta-hydroxyalkanoate depolymerase